MPLSAYMRSIEHGRVKRLIYAGVVTAGLAVPATAVALSVGTTSPTHAARGGSSSAVQARAASDHQLVVAHEAAVSNVAARKAAAAARARKAAAAKAARAARRRERLARRHREMVRKHREMVRKHRRELARKHREQVRRHRELVRKRRELARKRREQAREQAQQTASAASAGSPLPECTWLPESGGDPTAVNPTSGAGGYYQILPSTWVAYGGTGLPEDAPMAEQTAIAEKIWATQGPSAWVNC